MSSLWRGRRMQCQLSRSWVLDDKVSQLKNLYNQNWIKIYKHLKIKWIQTKVQLEPYHQFFLLFFSPAVSTFSTPSLDFCIAVCATTGLSNPNTWGQLLLSSYFSNHCPRHTSLTFHPSFILVLLFLPPSYFSHFSSLLHTCHFLPLSSSFFCS